MSRNDVLEEAALVVDAKHDELAARSYPPPAILKELAASIRALKKPALAVEMEGAYSWEVKRPPAATLVMVKWGVSDKGWTLVRTCARGCCVFPHPADGMGSMILPKYWREPTASEAAVDGRGSET